MNTFRTYTGIACCAVVIFLFYLILVSNRQRDQRARINAAEKGIRIQETLNKMVRNNNLNVKATVDSNVVNLYDWPNLIEIFVSHDLEMRGGGLDIVVYDLESQDILSYSLPHESGGLVLLDSYYRKTDKNWNELLEAIRTSYFRIIPK
jgi:hypothetical protein